MPGDGNRTPPSTVDNPKGLLVSESQRPAFVGDPVAATYLRKFVGGAEVLEGSDRYCIWMPDPVSPDIRASQELQTRLSHVEKFRRNSTYFAIRCAATTPHAFARVSQPSQQFLCVPRHFTSERDYITASYLDADVIAGDALQVTEDPDGLIFAVLSSSMFMAQRA
jgi:hypothetical protein